MLQFAGAAVSQDKQLYIYIYIYDLQLLDYINFLFGCML